MREKIIKLLQVSINKNQKSGFFPKFAVPDVKIERPDSSAFGDYSSNLALAVSKIVGKNPLETADLIVKSINHQESAALFDKVEVAPPGFINLFVSQKLIFNGLQNIIKQKRVFGRSSWQRNKKIIVEFTDPNPFKEFHIGHLYTNTVGEAIAKLQEATGAKVKRANYQGDVGLHVAKAVWGVRQKMAIGNINLASLEQKELKERIKFLGESYAYGAKSFEENEAAKQEIITLNKKIFDLDPEIKEIYERGRRWSLDCFEEVYRRIGARFDYYYFESKVGKTGLKLVKDNIKNGVFQESQGAVIFPGEKYGLHSRVFINSQGLPTYEAKELGLALVKYKDFRYDVSIIITGNEIIDYFQVLIAALKKVSPELGEKTIHIPHGTLRLSEGKMSSRSGNVVTAESFLNRIKELAGKLTESSDESRGSNLTEIITLGAVKYALLKASIGQDVIFDQDKSVSIKGDSGPYLQYACVRCRSVLKKSKSGVRGVRAPKNYNNLSKEETEISRLIFVFPDVVREAAEKFAPNLICGFAFDLAQRYNAFYDRYPILKAENEEVKRLRLLLTAAVAQTLENALFLLGIEVPEKM